MENKILIHTSLKNSSSYLAHYGIKGTQWGVRNGPPYPLTYEQHNAAERKANPKAHLDNYGMKDRTYKLPRTSSRKSSGSNRSSKSESIVKQIRSSAGGQKARINADNANNSKRIPFYEGDQSKDTEGVMDDVKKEILNGYEKELRRYENWSEREKAEYRNDEELHINSAEEWADFWAKEFITETTGYSDEQAALLIKELKKDLPKPEKNLSDEQLFDWVAMDYHRALEDYDDFSEERKVELKEDEENPINDADEYADYMMKRIITENSDHTDEEAVGMIEKWKKEHKSITQRRHISQSDKTQFIAHHGIAGQKWGTLNGPPYPLDYNDHSAAEKKGDYRYDPDKDHPKKNKPLKNMTGNKGIDKKIMKETYANAKYAKAASKEIAREREEANKRLDKLTNAGKSMDKINAAKLKARNLADIEKKANAEASKKMKELSRVGKEFSSLYGEKKAKKFSADSINNMSDKKARNFIYNQGHGAIAGAFIGGIGTGIVAGAIQTSRNKSSYEAYKADLKGNKKAAEVASRSAQRKDTALKGYLAYKTYDRYRDYKDAKNANDRSPARLN